MKALKNLWRRWLLVVRGECAVDGCSDIRAAYFERCPQHEAEDFARFCKARRDARFDRDAEVVAEGIRRAHASTQPHHDQHQEEGGGHGG